MVAAIRPKHPSTCRKRDSRYLPAPLPCGRGEVTENPTFGESRQRKKISLQVRSALCGRGDDDLVLSVSVRAPFQLILLLACVASASAELESSALSPPAQRADAVSQARITGHVVLGDTHEPARNTVVLLISVDGQNRQFQRVGLDGTYLFEHVVAGEYIVITYLDGYLSSFDKVTFNPSDHTIASLFEQIVAAQGSLKVGAQGTQTYDISLERGAIVSGRVFYSDGSPAIQVGIELQNTAFPSPRSNAPSIQLGDIARSEFVHREPETDDQGRFRVAGIRPGTYRIAAVQLQKLPMQAEEGMVRSIMGALRFYTNDTVHPMSAKTYNLAAGQELTGLEIRIPLDGFHSVQGKVVAQDGRPITNAGVTITETSDPSLYFLAVVSDGLFRVDRLPPGTYNVSTPFGNIVAGGAVTAAFGMGSTSFTIKDADLNGVILTLPEATLPKLTEPAIR